VPLPLPDAPLVTVSHEALLAAIQAHPSGAVTATVSPVAPSAGADCAVGATPTAHPAAGGGGGVGEGPVEAGSCVSVNTCPAIVSVPTRAAPPFGLTTNCCEPLPTPPLAPATVIHETSLEVVQAHPGGAVTLTRSGPPSAKARRALGAIAEVQVTAGGAAAAAAPWLMVTSWPAMDTEPDRAAPVFPATCTLTVPGPLREGLPITVIQSAPAPTVQPHPCAVVTTRATVPPAPATSCSSGVNGYLVFEPDIHYEMGYPGPSAVKSVVPGVQKLLERGYVDPKRLGLQGQSWGGYQALYIITQTQMFAAAMAGAPVANMTSAYGGIRWGSGVNRSMQYEAGQSRIGKSLFEAPDLYLQNSPLFSLPRVSTPLFIMSNDMDDAVPWWQGIELFVGMRRLGKEAYLINYNNDVHNPQSRANQKDIAMRMEQFFDNKLKGAPMPEWMEKGIPAKDKGKDQVKKVIQP
jgi:hypothetical protein